MFAPDYYISARLLDNVKRIAALVTELNFIEDHGFINNQQYSQITTRAKATRSKDLQELVKKGILERKGKTRGTYYIIKHSAPDTDG